MRSARGVLAWTAALAIAAVAAVVVLARRDFPLHVTSAWMLLPLFAALMVGAERLRVRVRIGGEIDEINVVEAVLAPLLFAFPGVVVVAVVAMALAISALPRRTTLVKNVFNLVQWTLAAACAALVVGHHHVPLHLNTAQAWRLVGALAVVWVVNNVAFLVVLGLARGVSPVTLAIEMRRVVLVAWTAGWALNVLVGLLYVVAYAGHPASTFLFAVPLVVLHLAYRGFATAQTDEQRLSGLHRAAQSLAAPVDPRDGVPDFLAAVAGCYDARAAALVVRAEGGRDVHVWDAGCSPAYTFTTQSNDEPTLEGALAALPAPLHVRPRDRHQLAVMLREHGWRDCLSAPMLDEGRHAGCLAVFDQDGAEGSAAGELAVLEALARETAGTFAKGRLLADVLEERRKLEEVVQAISDGMTSIAADGTVLSWNRALERLTGIPASAAVGRVDPLLRLQPQTLDGATVDLARWTQLRWMPAEVRITALDGVRHRLSCSYNRVDDEDGLPRVLVIVARDVTTDEEIAVLREEFARLSEEQAAAREVVEQLQQAVVPPAPAVEHTQLAVEYVPSDANAPTGGDLYDWHVLPDGDVHLAVVDVLGHGVSATKAALSVVHTLRVVASQGTPLADIIARTDALLGGQDPDLVATAVVARYTPATGELRVANGGHPPGLVLHPDGRVTQIAATGGAIGWPGAGSDEVSRLMLAPGDTLLLYTDGLVEARKNLLEGLEELTRYAGDVADLPTAELPSVLVRRVLAGAQRRDDTLALALRRLADAPAAFTSTIGPDASAAAALRRGLVAWVAERGLRGDDVAVVAGELLANAVRAARTAVTVTAALDGAGVRLCVADDGAGDPEVDVRGHQLPEEESLSGRGLYIARALTSSLAFTSTPLGTTVTASVPAEVGLPPQPQDSEDAIEGLSLPPV